MSQIGLVAHQHNDNVLIGMIAQLPQPSLYIFVRQMLGNVVDEQCSDSTTIICRCNGPITLLSGRIPYLRLDCFTIDLVKSETLFIIHLFKKLLIALVVNLHLTCCQAWLYFFFIHSCTLSENQSLRVGEVYTLDSPLCCALRTQRQLSTWTPN